MPSTTSVTGAGFKLNTGVARKTVISLVFTLKVSQLIEVLRNKTFPQFLNIKNKLSL